jgi:hypothetical protein
MCGLDIGIVGRVCDRASKFRVDVVDRWSQYEAFHVFIPVEAILRRRVVVVRVHRDKRRDNTFTWKAR